MEDESRSEGGGGEEMGTGEEGEGVLLDLVASRRGGPEPPGSVPGDV